MITKASFAGYAFVLATVAFATSAVANAPAGRYTIANGTVFDTKTKLTWQQTPSTNPLTEANAAGYCAFSNLGAPSSAPSWRLPSVRELQTLLDFSQTFLARLDQTAFPGTPPDAFWSSTRVVANNTTSTTQGWIVDFTSWQSLQETLTDSHFVRCVR
jgi:hypothetical protein